MAYVPTIPGVPAPMSYGQGYGNWQQYAGFDKTSNPYGGGEGLGVQPVPQSDTAPTSLPVIDTNLPTQTYSPIPAPTGQLGVNPQNSLGLKPFSQLGQTPQSLQDVINNHYGVR